MSNYHQFLYVGPLGEQEDIENAEPPIRYFRSADGAVDAYLKEQDGILEPIALEQLMAEVVQADRDDRGVWLAERFGHFERPLVPELSMPLRDQPVVRDMTPPEDEQLVTDAVEVEADDEPARPLVDMSIEELNSRFEELQAQVRENHDKLQEHATTIETHVVGLDEPTLYLEREIGDRSVLLEHAWYSPSQRKMWLRYHNGLVVRAYNNIPEDIWDGLVDVIDTGGSVGTYFNRKVHRQYKDFYVTTSEEAEQALAKELDL